MADKDLNELFVDTLKDIYYAEKQIYKSLPKMAKAASSDQLRAAFEKHLGETETQIERLEKIFELLGKPARGKKCDAIEGILDEGKEIMDEYEDAPALDAGLLAGSMRRSPRKRKPTRRCRSWRSPPSAPFASAGPFGEQGPAALAVGSKTTPSAIRSLRERGRRSR